MAGLRIGLAVALSILAGASLAGAAGYKPPRTASGAPDIEGVWTNASMTKLQHPA